MSMPEPTVGMGATWSPLSDCYPCTVIQVNENGTKIVTCDDDAVVVGGNEMDGSAEYVYYQTDGVLREWTKRKNGRWAQVGASMHDGPYLTLGSRRKYRDPHF